MEKYLNKMISYSELEKGKKILINNTPFEILEISPLFKGRGHSVLQSKIKNLITGEIISHTFHPSDSFKEAEISKFRARFIYSHRGKYVFCEENNPKNRFELNEEKIGKIKDFLKPNQEVEALVFENKVINISLPIKIQLKVTDAPPGIKGDRVQSGTKKVILETGAEIDAPLFIEKGDVIEINTQTFEYVRRVKKA